MSEITGKTEHVYFDFEYAAGTWPHPRRMICKAEVVRQATGREARTEFRSEFLHFFQATERLRSHMPVTVQRGGSQFRADAVEYDNLAQVIELKGRVRAVLAPDMSRLSTP